MVLIIGGTRGTGRIIAELLQTRGDRVRLLARDPSRVRAWARPNLDVIAGDITKESTLAAAIDGARHIVFTAGVRSGRPSTEARIKATEYVGVVNTLSTAGRVGFSGRFLYMTASGVTTRSFATFALNLWKGNTLVWRRRAEEEIRRSGLDYTIIRAGVLLNRPGGQHAMVVTQETLPLSLRYRVARADIAAAFVAALDHPRTARATFEVVWGSKTQPREPWSKLFDRLESD
jgi:uncharacterized protein YbjT (DUF2867 family)